MTVGIGSFDESDFYFALAGIDPRTRSWNGHSITFDDSPAIQEAIESRIQAFLLTEDPGTPGYLQAATFFAFKGSEGAYRDLVERDIVELLDTPEGLLARSRDGVIVPVGFFKSTWKFCKKHSTAILVGVAVVAVVVTIAVVVASTGGAAAGGAAAAGAAIGRQKKDEKRTPPHNKPPIAANPPPPIPPSITLSPTPPIATPFDLGKMNVPWGGGHHPLEQIWTNPSPASSFQSPIDLQPAPPPVVPQPPLITNPFIPQDPLGLFQDHLAPHISPPFPQIQLPDIPENASPPFT